MKYYRISWKKYPNVTSYGRYINELDLERLISFWKRYNMSEFFNIEEWKSTF